MPSASPSQLWRLCRIGGGVGLLLVGLFLSLPGIPGPGIVLVVLSFGILSRDFKWAERWHNRLKDRAQEFIRRRKAARASANRDEKTG